MCITCMSAYKLGFASSHLMVSVLEFKIMIVYHGTNNKLHPTDKLINSPAAGNSLTRVQRLCRRGKTEADVSCTVDFEQ